MHRVVLVPSDGPEAVLLLGDSQGHFLFVERVRAPTKQILTLLLKNNEIIIKGCCTKLRLIYLFVHNERSVYTFKNDV